MDESIGDTFVSAAGTGWGPGRFDAELALDAKPFRPDGKKCAVLIPTRIPPGWRKPAHMDRMGLGPYPNGFRQCPQPNRPLIISKSASLRFCQLAIPAP